MSTPPTSPPNLTALAGDIVAAYVRKNSVPVTELPKVLKVVQEALLALVTPPKANPERAVGHIPIKKTVTADYIISLEDGRSYRSLKRHLTTRGITPEQYRAKWGLPPNYPMVAANYAALRSEVAKSSGLGGNRRGHAASTAGQAPEAQRVRRTGGGAT